MKARNRKEGIRNLRKTLESLTRLSVQLRQLTVVFPAMFGMLVACHATGLIPELTLRIALAIQLTVAVFAVAYLVLVRLQVRRRSERIEEDTERAIKGKTRSELREEKLEALLGDQKQPSRASTEDTPSHEVPDEELDTDSVAAIRETEAKAKEKFMDILERTLILIRVTVVSCIIGLSISIGFSIHLRYDPPHTQPCCPDVNVNCPPPPMIGDSSRWIAGPGGVSDSTVVALLRSEHRTWLATLKEQNALQAKTIEEQNKTLRLAMERRGGSGEVSVIGSSWYWLVGLVAIGALIAIVRIQQSDKPKDTKQRLSLYSFLTALAIACMPSLIELIDHHICGCPPDEKHEDGTKCSCQECGGHSGDTTIIDASVKNEIAILSLKLENTKLELKQYIDAHCTCPPVKPPVKRKCVKNSCDVIKEIEVLQHRLDSLCTVVPKASRP